LYAGGDLIDPKKDESATKIYYRPDTAPEGYISKDIYILSYIQKSPKKDIFYPFWEQDILRI
jgi:hypothetical protein